MIRALAAAALILAAALLPAVPHAVPHAHAPVSDSGCSLYVSVPNPCDPDSNN